MSSDNGVYVAQFPTTLGEVEYRVTIANAVDDCFCAGAEKQDHLRAFHFHDAAVFRTRRAARFYATILEGGYAIEQGQHTEYRVQELRFDRPLLNKTVAEARAWLDGSRDRANIAIAG